MRRPGPVLWRSAPFVASPSPGALPATAVTLGLLRPPPPPWRRLLAPVRDQAAPIAGAICLVASLALGASALSSIDLRRVDDLGLISVLPARAAGAVVLLSASFCALLRRPRRNRTLLVLHVVALVVMLFGVTVFREEVVSINVTWRHAGIADHIARSGTVAPSIDAYFNWPGFFALIAMFTRLTGLDVVRHMAPWAPVYFNLLFLVPIVMLLRTTTHDARVVWLSVWFFLLGNWVGQDYFSPQAEGFFLHLVILAVLLTWFRRTGDGRSFAIPVPPATGQREQAALVLVMILVFAAMVPSHQLTPFATVASVTALVLFGRSRARGLHVLFAVMLAAWISFMTVTFLAGRIDQLLAAVGAVTSNTSAGVGERLRGSADHLFVVRARLLMTAGVWGLALLGGLRRWRLRQIDRSFVLLALAPFALVGLQSYGGEMLLRAYLYALPFMALFAASLFFPSPRAGRRWRTTVAAWLTCVALFGGFLLARYGNERASQFSVEEARAVDRLYRLAPPGAVLLSATGNLPWRSQGYADYRYRTVKQIERDLGHSLPHVGDVAGAMSKWPAGCGFVIITRAEKAYAELFGVWPPGVLDHLTAELRASRQFEVRYANRDATIFARLEVPIHNTKGVTNEATSDAGRRGRGVRCLSSSGRLR